MPVCATGGRGRAGCTLSRKGLRGCDVAMCGREKLIDLAPIPVPQGCGAIARGRCSGPGRSTPVTSIPTRSERRHRRVPRPDWGRRGRCLRKHQLVGERRDNNVLTTHGKDVVDRSHPGFSEREPLTGPTLADSRRPNVARATLPQKLLGKGTVLPAPSHNGGREHGGQGNLDDRTPHRGAPKLRIRTAA